MLGFSTISITCGVFDANLSVVLFVVVVVGFVCLCFFIRGRGWVFLCCCRVGFFVCFGFLGFF